MRTYYVGLDVHSKNSAFVIEDEDGKVIARGEVPTTSEGFGGLQATYHLANGTQVALETGTVAFFVARFVNPAARTAAVTALATALSCAWCRRTAPDRGSTDSFADGNTYCQRNSAAAAGNLRSRAWGRYTRPYPAAKSFSCSRRTRSR